MSSKKSKIAMLIADRLNFKPLINSAITKAIEIECPFSIAEITSKNKKIELAMWRHAVMVTFVLNGNKVYKVGEMFNRQHDSVLHSLRNTNDELDIKAKDGIVDRIMKLYNCALNYNYCRTTTFKIQKYDSGDING